MQWRGWINDGITKPPNGPLWRDIGCCVCPRCRTQEGMATGAASANCPRRSENPPAARFFTHLSFRVAFSGACLITLDWGSSFRRTPAWISSFLADLTHILERYGNRGYRAVPLEAGTIGGRMYLAAYAQRLGSTGLTFFDDDVTHFFSHTRKIRVPSSRSRLASR